MSELCASNLKSCVSYLFFGVACSCEACAGVRHRDEHAPWTGSLTSCPILTPLDRCLGTCTSVCTLPRCRTRTPRAATHWPASSVNTSWMQDPNLYCSSTVPSIPWDNCDLPTVALHKHSTCDLSYTEIVKQYVSFIILKHGCVLLFPPSLIWLLLVSPSPSSLGPFFLPWRENLGGNNDQKTSFRPHAERVVRERGPRGTVLSNNICAIHSWDMVGAENKAQSRGGGGWNKGEVTQRGLFSQVS